jgi:isopentenyl-diphosphate delta-isomerase
MENMQTYYFIHASFCVGKAIFLPEDELVEVIDADNIPLSTKTLSECKMRGLLHRSVTVFLRNSLGEIFLQQRSLKDNWFPGRWTAFSTGHVKAGESPSDAAKRELVEELGLNLDPQVSVSTPSPENSFSR